MAPLTPDKLYLIVGSRIAAARRARQWSQSQLATEAKLSRGSIANIERGRQQPPLWTIWNVAKALAVEPRSLIPTSREVGGGEDQNGVNALPKKAREIVEASGPTTRRALGDLMDRIRGDDGE